MLGADGCGDGASVRLEPHGYVCVMNAPDEDGAADSPFSLLEQQNATEQIFFSNCGMADMVASQRAGSNSLIHRLESMYTQYLTITWLPKTITLLVDKLDDVERQVPPLGLPGSTSPSGLVPTDETFTQYCRNALDDSVIKEKLAGIKQIASAALRRDGGYADDGWVDTTFNDHREAHIFVTRKRGEMVNTARRLLSDVTQFWGADLDARLAADVSPFKFGRFPRAISTLSARYATEADAILQAKLAEADRLITTHFTLPYPCIEFKCLSDGKVLVRMRPGKVFNDILYLAVGVTSDAMLDALHQSINDVMAIPDLWTESCAPQRMALLDEVATLRQVMKALLELSGKHTRASTPKVVLQQARVGNLGNDVEYILHFCMNNLNDNITACHKT